MAPKVTSPIVDSDTFSAGPLKHEIVIKDKNRHVLLQRKQGCTKSPSSRRSATKLTSTNLQSGRSLGSLRNLRLPRS